MSDFKLAKKKEGALPSNVDDFKNHIYVLAKRNNNPTLEDCFYPKTYKIPGIDEVYMEWTDPKTGILDSGNRLIRYIPGERSIFADEQSELADNPKKIGNIVFTDGFLIVNGKDKNKRMFLDLCNWNKGNEETRTSGKSTIFYKEDRTERAKDNFDSRKEIHDLQGKMFDCTFNELKAYAMTFDVRGYNSLSADELRASLHDLIAYDPKKFKEELNSPARVRKYWILKAFEEGILRRSANKSAIEYTLGGIEKVCDIPSINSNEVDFITELSDKSPEVSDLVSKIKSFFTIGSVPLSKTLTDKPDDELNEYEVLLNASLKFNVIYRAGAYFKFTETDLGTCGRTASDFEQTMKANKTLHQKCKLLVEQAKEYASA